MTKDFKMLLQTDTYDFIRTHERLGKQDILLGLGGAI